MEDSSLYFQTGQPYSSCVIHPVVIISVLDHHIRRNEGERVIGTLLGVVNDGVVEIRNCFPVLHSEADQVCVDMDFQNNMMELHHRVSAKEGIVGWYSSSADIDETSVMIHDFYGKRLTNPPVHVTVDTNLTNYTMSVKAYTSTAITFNEKSLGSQFLPVPLEIGAFDAEKIGVDVLMKTQNGDHNLLTELESLQVSLEKLDSMLNTVSDYVNKVLEDKVEGDSSVGRFLAATVSVLPKIDPSTLEKIFNNNVQDLLLIVYLANLTRTQLQLSEKLQKIV